MAKVSIIIPVYNMEEYVEQCVRSLFDQTEEDIEIIAVNDGSTDGSGLILDRLAKEDSRLRVIHKENEGVSASRNAGLDSAKGDWITFVDSDDWCDPEMLKTSLSLSDRYDGCEIVIFALTTDVAENTPDIHTRFLPLDEGNVTDHREFIELCTMSKYYSSDLGKPGPIPIGGTCAKLVRRSLVERLQLRFNTILVRSQDTVFWLELFENAQEICYLDKELYHYRRWMGSVTYGARYIPDSGLAFGEILKEYESFIKRHDKDERFTNALYLRAADIIVWNLKHNFANKTNKAPLSQRRKDLSDLMHSEPYRSAVRRPASRPFRLLTLLLRMRLYGVCIISYEIFSGLKRRLS